MSKKEHSFHLQNKSHGGKRKRDVEDSQADPKLDQGDRQAWKKLLRSRADLPIWPHASAVRLSLLGDRHVLILAGETGSGKSTQVPQFLMSQEWCKGAIAVTQPRRVAATSLARRVAEEVDGPLGMRTPSSRVGYSVRFDQKFSSNTRIKYLTEGMLLQELLRDRLLRQYTVVVVDEVHERSVNVDLILGFLRNIVQTQVKSGEPPGKWRHGAGPLKVVVMSATADTEKLFWYFADSFDTGPSKRLVANQESSEKRSGTAAINGNFNDESPGSDSTWEGLSSTGDSENAEGNSSGPTVITGSFSKYISTIYVEGRQHPVQTSYLQKPSTDYLDSALKAIFQIHYKEPLPGDILVFLPGQDTIEALQSLVADLAAQMGPEVPSLLIQPLFAALPQKHQQKVFIPTQPKTRKVILATNIAETSLTIPGISHVIDSGLHKVREFRPQLGLDTLLVKPISKSGAIQRKGRAGRQGPGKCYRLYTEETFLSLEDEETPEILRCDLAASLLIMKSRGYPDVLSFPYLDPPSSSRMRNAVESLRQLQAVDEETGITSLGRRMAQLPLPPHLARIILVAAEPRHSCVLDAIDVVACLTGDNVFLQLGSEEAREEAEEARRELFRREGDHLTLLATVQAYAAENADRKAWCKRYFVHHRAMQNIMDVRKQLRTQCKSIGVLSKEVERDETHGRTESGDSTALLKPLLEGHSMNVARLHADGSYKTIVGSQTVAVHPSSVLFGRQRKADAIMFSEMVFTNRCWARCVSEVHLHWLEGLKGFRNGMNGSIDT